MRKNKLTTHSIKISIITSLLSLATISCTPLQKDDEPIQDQVSTQVSQPDSTYSRLIEDFIATKTTQTLTPEQENMAQLLTQRAYSLYPDTYYQQGIDNALERITSGVPSNSTNAALVQCALNMSTVENFKEYMQGTARMYVIETPKIKLKEDLSMINHFFIDELATAIQIDT